MAFVLLIVAGIGGLFFGFRYLGKNLTAPFAFSYSGPKSLTSTEQDAAKMADLKTRDTDADGLNDYDELYVYKTSPYLADSDSDGFSDATELASGNDPNCPQGKTCGTSSAPVDAGSALTDGFQAPQAPDLVGAQQALDQAGGAANVLQSMTPAELRELLIQNGADKASLDKMTDDQLMKMYTDILGQYQSDGTTTATDTGTAPSTTTP